MIRLLLFVSSLLLVQLPAVAQQTSIPDFGEGQCRVPHPGVLSGTGLAYVIPAPGADAE